MRPYGSNPLMPSNSGERAPTQINRSGFGIGSGLGLSLAGNRTVSNSDVSTPSSGQYPNSPLVASDPTPLEEYHRRRANLPVAPPSPDYAFFPVSPILSSAVPDDWSHPSQVPGERVTLDFQNIHYISARGVETLGSFTMTYYQLYFISYPRKLQLGKLQPLNRPMAIPLHSIDTITVDQRSVRNVTSAGNVAAWVDVLCKDARMLRFGFESVLDCDRVVKVINSYANPMRLADVFAYEYGKAFQAHLRANLRKLTEEDPDFPALYGDLVTEAPVPLPEAFDGWRLFNPMDEYTRMRLPLDKFRVSRANAEYKLCASYPSLLVVPQEGVISDLDYARVTAFRTSGRAPALTWKNPHGDQTIWRSSQPQSGMLNSRCPEDERLVEFIGKSNGVNQGVKIFDARPMANAMGNSLAGKGYESSNCYKTSTVLFMNIDNIHKVRDSYRRLIAAVSGPAKSDAQLYAEIGQSQWFYHTHNILKAVVEMVAHIDHAGGSLLCHCSDGWDRTSQLTSLTKLCVDPFYRTIRGFITLIEHEWLSFGHKFHERLAQPGAKFPTDQRSPVFLQFLDCVHQLLVQFPRHFEFTSQFLVEIAVHSQTCRFGTFLFNCERERRMGRFKPSRADEDDPNALPVPATFGAPAHEGGMHVLAKETVSLWTYLLASPAAVAGVFTNALYATGGCGDAADVDQPWPYAYREPELPFAAPVVRDLGPSGPQPLEAPMTRGSVLYPCYDVRRLELWGDFFLRHHKEDSYLPILASAGNMYPGGATTASLAPVRVVPNQHLLWARMVAKDACAAFVSEHNKRVRAERKVEKLQRQLDMLRHLCGAELSAAIADLDAEDEDAPVRINVKVLPQVVAAGATLDNLLSTHADEDAPAAPAVSPEEVRPVSKGLFDDEASVALSTPKGLFDDEKGADEVAEATLPTEAKDAAETPAVVNVAANTATDEASAEADNNAVKNADCDGAEADVHTAPFEVDADVASELEDVLLG